MSLLTVGQVEHKILEILRSRFPEHLDRVSFTAFKTTPYILKKHCWEVTRHVMSFLTEISIVNDDFNSNPRSYVTKALMVTDESDGMDYSTIQIYRVPSKDRTFLWFPSWPQIAREGDIIAFIHFKHQASYFYALNCSQDSIARVLESDTNPLVRELKDMHV